MPSLLPRSSCLWGLLQLHQCHTRAMVWGRCGNAGLTGQVSSLRGWGCLCHFPRWIWTFWTFSLHRRNIIPLPYLAEGKKSPESPDSPLIPVFPMIPKIKLRDGWPTQKILLTRLHRFDEVRQAAISGATKKRRAREND
jgi:hypothetical protein